MDEPPQRPYLADWWPRVGATLLDSVIIGAISFGCLIVSVLALAPFGADGDTGAPVWLLLTLVAGATYYTGLTARKGENNGQTFGKQAAGIRVVRDDGRPIRGGFAFMREVGLKLLIANILLIGWLIDSLWPLGEKENRALHDLIMHTHVVSTKPAKQPRIPPPSRPPVTRPALAPPIARHIDAAHRIQAGIAAAVQRAELPYTAVSHEVGSLVHDLERSAMRAQLLYEALSETPVASIEQRLAHVVELEQPELALALREQLVVQRRLRKQLQGFDGEMERMVIELDTVRANLVSTAASGDAQNQEHLAERVRSLRDEMSAVSEGMDTGYNT
jgi:uncharacterized RDD family membrane protein YckC